MSIFNCDTAITLLESLGFQFVPSPAQKFGSHIALYHMQGDITALVCVTPGTDVVFAFRPGTVDTTANIADFTFASDPLTYLGARSGTRFV